MLFLYIPYNKRDIFLKDVSFSPLKTSFITDDTDSFIIDAKKYENSCLHSFSIEQIVLTIQKQTIYTHTRYYERKNVNFQSVKFVNDWKTYRRVNTDEFNKNNEDLLREIDQWKDKYNTIPRKRTMKQILLKSRQKNIL